jgi:hypothetical protein
MINRLFPFLLILVACETEHTPKNVILKENTQESSKDWVFSEAMTQEIRTGLTIGVDEKFDTTTVFEHLNDDGIKDAVITINLLERAKLDASNSKNPAKVAEMGYAGPYNYIMTFDGATKRFTHPTIIQSSPKSALEIKFCNIESMRFKTIIVQYRLLNAAFWTWMSMETGKPVKIFQWNVFDKIGETIPEAQVIEYKPNLASTKEDIIIYDGKILDYTPSKIVDKTKYTPIIEKIGVEKYHFFYDPAQRSYMIPKGKLKEN